MLIHQHSEELARALSYPDTDSVSAEIPNSVDRASKVLGFDSSGVPIASSSFGTAVTAFIATLVDDADAGAALTTLGLSAYAQTLIDDATAGAARATLEIAPKNGVTNPDFGVWQRGTSRSGGAFYGPDRWKLDDTGSEVGKSTTRQSGANNASSSTANIRYAARVQRSNGQTWTTTMRLTQIFETQNSYRYAGKTVTLSFWARKGTDFSAASNILTSQPGTGTGSDDSWANFVAGGWAGHATFTKNHTLTNLWQRFEHTFTTSASMTQIGLSFHNTPVGTAGADDWYEIDGVQIEVASEATEFERVSDRELSRCQRYYRVYGGEISNELVSIGQGISGTGARVPLTFPEMRAAPTFAMSAVGDWGMMHAAGTIETITGLTASIITKRSCQMDITTAANMVAGNGTIMRGINSNARVTLDAEL